jgi:hypothetical protein
MAAIALLFSALTSINGAKLLKADFEDLKGQLAGPPLRDGYSESDSRASGATSTWSFTENGQSCDATFEDVAHCHAIMESNSGVIAVYHPGSQT